MKITKMAVKRPANAEPNLAGGGRQPGGLILVYAHRRWRQPHQVECLPDVRAVHVFAESPGGLTARGFRRKHIRRSNVVGDFRRMVHPQLPREFAQREDGFCEACLELFVLSYRDTWPNLPPPQARR